MASNPEKEMSANKRGEVIAIASYILAALALLLVLHLGLLAALFSGLLVYALVQLIAPHLGKKLVGRRARMFVVALLSAAIVTALTALIWGGVTFLRSDAGSMQVLLRKMADVLEATRGQIPDWLAAYVPVDAEALRTMIVNWLHAHAIEARTIGATAGRILAHILIGMIIGAMAALFDTTTTPAYRPLAAALHARVVTLHNAFSNVVFAQVRIAAINAILTGIYLLVILPLCGVELPLRKTMVVVTFLVGLLPVVGNLVSNTILVVIGLSHSLHIALISLVFLIGIHKLEYFLNARIIGHHINARTWELLAAMLVMEAMFGIPGLIAAPVFYAYIKRELSDRGLV
ncbi:AI-2E family transporter [Oxalicibacterium faecigallinarum]|uniref:Membrane protein n=1 Tax=Oxalicibacterium faecigallinarum TaxID=573741 RepID=A0A8J3F3G5_9BURK|nr:AI-2E family transporter [Oxalicibacterium faecigallinarum]GGI19014.1 membrane protein [Oxalicibacterium faecigallinarum]